MRTRVVPPGLVPIFHFTQDLRPWANACRRFAAGIRRILLHSFLQDEVLTYTLKPSSLAPNAALEGRLMDLERSEARDRTADSSLRSK